MQSALGGYIRAKRKAAGLSQDELAERMPYTQPAISAWETGLKVPTVRAVAALAAALPEADINEMVALVAEEPVA